MFYYYRKQTYIIRKYGKEADEIRIASSGYRRPKTTKKYIGQNLKKCS